MGTARDLISRHYRPSPSPFDEARTAPHLIREISVIPGQCAAVALPSLVTFVPFVARPLTLPLPGAFHVRISPRRTARTAETEDDPPSPRLPPSLYELRRDTSAWQATRTRTIEGPLSLLGLLRDLPSPPCRLPSSLKLRRTSRRDKPR